MDSGCGNPPSKRRLRFGRSRRLLKRPDFVEVYQTGKKAYGRYAVVFCRRRTGEAEPETWRLGITATRKTGKAVRRNRQKRLIREYFRLNQDWIGPVTLTLKALLQWLHGIF